MIPDDALLNRLRAGDDEAWELIVAEFEGPIYRYFFCQQRNHHVAQEQTAETFAQLVRSLPNFRGTGEQFRAYVFGISRNVQRRQWRAARSEPKTLSATLEVRDRHASFEHQIADLEQFQRAIRAISGLDEPVRDSILLRFVEGLSMREIADALDCPVGTIKSHIHRGLSRLKEILKDEECEA